MAKKEITAKHVAHRRIKHNGQVFTPGDEFNPTECTDAQLARLVADGGVAIEGETPKGAAEKALPDEDPSQTQ